MTAPVLMGVRGSIRVECRCGKSLAKLHAVWHDPYGENETFGPFCSEQCREKHVPDLRANRKLAYEQRFEQAITSMETVQTIHLAEDEKYALFLRIKTSRWRDRFCSQSIMAIPKTRLPDYDPTKHNSHGFQMPESILRPEGIHAAEVTYHPYTEEFGDKDDTWTCVRFKTASKTGIGRKHMYVLRETAVKAAKKANKIRKQFQSAQAL